MNYAIYLVLALLLTLSPYASADFQTGAAAAGKGDFTTAMKEWKPAAAAGNADAQYNLGALLLSGKVGTPDFQNGVSWIEKAAKQGHVEAAYSLGMIFYTGLGDKI